MDLDLLALLAAAGVPAQYLLLIALAVTGASSILAAFFPQPAPGSRWALARRVLDLLAANVGHARNRTLADRLAAAAGKGDPRLAMPGTIFFDVDGSKEGAR